MDSLTYWTEKRDDADKAIANWVRAAKRAGATWQAIGDVLGVTKQRAQQKYGAMAAEPNRYTCNCGWSHIIPEDAEGITRETAVVLEHIDTQHPELKAPARLAAVRECTATDSHQPGTPSIFSDAQSPATPRMTAGTSNFSDAQPPAKSPRTAGTSKPAPAPDEFRDPRPEFVLRSAGKIDGTAQPGTGKGPHQCPRCGNHNHKTSKPDAIRAYLDCTPTKYDPQDITDHLNNTGLSKKS